ncbi:hypothetical protein RHSIM_Rhsim04G0233500 [Rhododendron simsii]|uniref:Uncharacterized protein n=1 Tax=Rhododendron simsii TaxID=118357 RepID=A0A834HEE5_RHOSS|nr:hypothetical protein RHSIM_Rhsim04G0233500 [Rhododendron simsii]
MASLLVTNLLLLLVISLATKNRTIPVVGGEATTCFLPIPARQEALVAQLFSATVSVSFKPVVEPSLFEGPLYMDERVPPVQGRVRAAKCQEADKAFQVARTPSAPPSQAIPSAPRLELDSDLVSLGAPSAPRSKAIPSAPPLKVDSILVTLADLPLGGDFVAADPPLSILVAPANPPMEVSPFASNS